MSDSKTAPMATPPLVAEPLDEESHYDVRLTCPDDAVSGWIEYTGPLPEVDWQR